ncbi:nitrogen regulation protein NR(II) [Solemya elarraichensis gill symbiont]|uniref:Sensory histidine kinase/phosphatase NtrB n=1 Tax=Solemya elarraichensis gill symbiont TaxID=1918949 RepID=A0A1T2LB40_9GAMM|nr:nitrogen regulation protein NR(II) [Solemya elarraichensis gill symbiont]OOZ42264.1 PAS domain-containing sensor histidine kinase [Solemya elarraichensis gill symbiont]
MSGYDKQHLLLDNLNTAVLVFDRDMLLRYVNPAAEILFAMSGKQLQGMSAREIIPCGDANAVKHLDKAWSSGHVVTEREIHVHFPGQEESITIDCTIMPFDDGGEGALMVEIQQVDRQLRITREEQMLAQQEVSSQLIRGLAHEIKNPLGGIRGAAQLLEQELDNSELEEYTSIIINEADRLRELVDRMLGPRELPSFESIDLHEVLERVRQLVKAEGGNGITLVRDYDPSIPPLHADLNQMIQVFLNITRNAANVLQGEGSITLRTRIMRHYTIGTQCHRLVARIDIIDTGPGIPQGLQEQIFFPMVSGSAQGTGLGLSIAQSLVAAHKGLIECHSEPGKTTFSVFIPLEIENGS